MKCQFFFSFMLILGFSACATVTNSEPVTSVQPALSPMLDVHFPTQEPKKDSTLMTQPTQPSYASGLEWLIEKAKEDLAQRLSISVTQIDLMEAKAVTWPDASLGCPQLGMKYKQIPYDGALIVLQAEGAVYEYHSGGSRGLFLCEKTYKDPSPPLKIDIFSLTPSKPDSDPSSDSPLPDNGIPPGEDQ